MKMQTVKTTFTYKANDGALLTVILATVSVSDVTGDFVLKGDIY